MEASLVMALDLSGDETTQPSDHTAYWTGQFPHKASGERLVALGEAGHEQTLSDGTCIAYMFSAKPLGDRYKDYEHKVSTYLEILGREARKIKPEATAEVWPVEVMHDDSRLFEYLETASARQETTDLARKVAEERVAIIGVGGTGSYVLDFVAKTWVKEIHLYDDDRFLQHNAFRVPGPVGVKEIQGGPNKADFHASRYAQMRRSVIAYPNAIDETNVEEIGTFDTVFLCIDGGPIKQRIFEICAQRDALCIDTGMGLYRVDDKLAGILRTTTSAPGHRKHVEENARIDMAGGGPGEYERNIQMAELNALNAALAVVKWKKIRGIYQDLVREGDSGYVVDGNRLINRDLLGRVERQ